MDDKELLQLYFDGALKGADAERAEKLIENDPEAASEFADMTAIRRACANERLAIAAPEESRERIFAAVGYATVGLPVIIKRYSLIAGALMFLTLSLYVIFNSVEDNKADVKDQTGITSNNSRQTAPPVISSKEIPQENTERTIASTRTNTQPRARAGRNYGSITTSPSPEANAITAQPIPPAPEVQYPAQDRRPELGRSAIAPTPVAHNALADAISIFEQLKPNFDGRQSLSSKKEKSVLLAFKGGSPMNNNVGFGKLTNFSASALWPTGKGVYFGVEGGSVYFIKDVKDEVTGEVSRLSDNVYFIGVASKYQPVEMCFINTSPFLAVTVGSSGYGTTLRPGIGLQRGILSDNVNLIIGYDYSLLFYKFDGSFKTSGTHNPYLGIMFKF